MITIHVQDINNDLFNSSNVYSILEFESLSDGLNGVCGLPLDLRTSLKLSIISTRRVRVADSLYMWRSNKLKRVIEGL